MSADHKSIDEILRDASNFKDLHKAYLTQQKLLSAIREKCEDVSYHDDRYVFAQEILDMMEGEK